jgi:glucose-6-phosphate isomerase
LGKLSVLNSQFVYLLHGRQIFCRFSKLQLPNQTGENTFMEKEALRVRLDYSNMMADNLPKPHGLSEYQITSFQVRTTQIHHDFLRRRERGEFAFMDLPLRKEVAEEIAQFAQSIRGRFENYVHLGIGGSALGPMALISALKHPYHNLLPQEKRSGEPRMFFLDNIDPDTFTALLDIIDVKKTLFAVVTKSGGTAETVASYLFFLQRLRAALGEKYRDHLVFVTDPIRGFLRKLAREENIRSFAIDPAVGGRFSVLTPVGLLPAAIAGIDIDQLLNGAAYMTRICQLETIAENPAYLFAILNYLAYQEGKRTVVMMPYSDRLYRIADWFRQLWAESLGKKVNRAGQEVHIGPLPVKALGATDQHSQVQLYVEGPNDKVFVFLEVEQFDGRAELQSPYSEAEASYLHGKSLNELIAAEKRATELALTQNHRPNMTFRFPAVSPFTVGQILQCLEIATAFAGELFDINAFDQPGVEAGKIATYALMGRPGYEEKARPMLELWKNRKEYVV